MSKLSKNITYNVLGQGVLLILGCVAIKYVFTQLGEDTLGIIYFTLTMNVMLCAALELGISYTTIREVSVHFHDEPEYVSNLIRTASLFYWGAYGLLVVLIYIMAPLLVEKWIILKTMDAGEATRVLQILGIAAMLVLPHSLYTSLFRGLQRMEFNNLIDVITMGLQMLGTIVILVFGGSVLPVVYWLSACFGLSIVMDLLIASRFVSWKVLVPGYSLMVIKRNMRFALHMMSISMLAMIHSQADKIIVSKMLPIGMFGYYGFAAGSLSRTMVVTNGIAQAALPSFSAGLKTGDRTSMMAQYRKLHHLVCFATAPLFAGIFFSALPLLAYLFNEEVTRMLFLPIGFLCIGYYMNGTLNVPYVFSLAAGKPEISARLNFLALFIVLPVTGILVYSYGLAGAAFSWVFYHMFAYSYVIPRIYSECLDLPVREWYSHILKTFILIGLTYGSAWMVLGWLDIHSLFHLLIAYAVASLGYLMGGFWLMGQELRGALYSLPYLMKARTMGIP